MFNQDFGFLIDLGETNASPVANVQRQRKDATITTEISSGSESSDGGSGSVSAGKVRHHHRHPVARNSSCRQPLSPAMSAARALSPSLRSLRVPGSPSPSTTAGSVSLQHQHLQQDALPLRSWSDAVSVRSLASIGMGSTDGRKLTIAKVPTSPAELLNLASPQT